MSSHTYVDYSQMRQVPAMGSIDTDGTTFEVEDVVVVPLVVEDAATLVSSHTVGDSVDATTAQTIARAVMDALKTYTS